MDFDCNSFQKINVSKKSHLYALGGKGVCALRGYFSPLQSQKLKVAFHKFHLIGLLEEWPKCKILAFILLLPVAMVTKMSDKIGFK